MNILKAFIIIYQFLVSASVCGARAMNINIWAHMLLIALCMTLRWLNKCHREILIRN